MDERPRVEQTYKHTPKHTDIIIIIVIIAEVDIDYALIGPTVTSGFSACEPGYGTEF